MAGRGSRLRPHTLTVPKPLVPIAGKPIVQRIVEELVSVCSEEVEHIGFVIGDFGDQVEQDLLEVAARAGAEGHIFHQDKPLGTAHAILCAERIMNSPLIVAFADTLFKAELSVNTEEDGLIWVSKVEDPSKFGVVKLNQEGIITEFVEKPESFVSDEAIIGIYYFKDGEYLKNELQYLIDNEIVEKGEYQLTSALENMKQKGTAFRTAAVEEWLDCGNKDAVVHTNNRILEFCKERGENLIADSSNLVNTTLVEPCYIGENVVIRDAIIGPHVSIGDNTLVESCVISNTLIQHNSEVRHRVLSNSMIGSHAKVGGRPDNLSVGDYTHIQ